LTRPIWLHCWQAILSIIPDVLRRVPVGGRQAPSPRSLFEYLSAHENADEQEQHDDDEDELDHDAASLGGDEKAPGFTPPGAGKANPRRAIILARRWHGRDGDATQDDFGRPRPIQPNSYERRLGLALVPRAKSSASVLFSAVIPGARLAAPRARSTFAGRGRRASERSDARGQCPGAEPWPALWHLGGNGAASAAPGP
jgi:hypothetical protein